MVFASWADIERLVQGMLEPEQRRLRMAIDSRRTIGRDETVAELFNKWQLSEYTHMFGAQGYALGGDCCMPLNGTSKSSCFNKIRLKAPLKSAALYGS
jgi:hypothetical protein